MLTEARRREGGSEDKNSIVLVVDKLPKRTWLDNSGGSSTGELQELCMLISYIT